MSRLRKIETVVKTKIEEMTIHYNVETDGLYLEGIEKGIEKGIEAGRTQKEVDFTLKLWALQEFSIPKIAMLVGITESRAVDVILHHLKTTGCSDDQAREVVDAYKKR